MLQPPPGTFGGTLGLGGADGFGGTGENNVMYAGEEQGEKTRETEAKRGREGDIGRKSQLTLLSGVCAGDPVTKVDKMFGFKLPPNAVAPRMQVLSERGCSSVLVE